MSFGKAFSEFVALDLASGGSRQLGYDEKLSNGDPLSCAPVLYLDQIYRLRGNDRSGEADAPAFGRQGESRAVEDCRITLNYRLDALRRSLDAANVDEVIDAADNF